jgi:putative transposase
MEEETRQKAILRYLKGESPKAIYKNLNRSKKWFFKWLKRYRTGAADWYKDESKAPISRPNQISAQQKELIIAIRKHLESEPFAQVGVSAIKWELTKLRTPFPSESTIKRILTHEGIVKKNSVCSQGS